MQSSSSSQESVLNLFQPHSMTGDHIIKSSFHQLINQLSFTVQKLIASIWWTVYIFILQICDWTKNSLFLFVMSEQISNFDLRCVTKRTCDPSWKIMTLFCFEHTFLAFCTAPRNRARLKLSHIITWASIGQLSMNLYNMPRTVTSSIPLRLEYSPRQVVRDWRIEL